jgi:hypothetical protein
VGEIGLPGFPGGRAHRDEDDVGLLDSGREVGREAQSAVVDVTDDHLLEAGLVDRHLPGLQ